MVIEKKNNFIHQWELYCFVFSTLDTLYKSLL